MLHSRRGGWRAGAGRSQDFAAEANEAGGVAAGLGGGPTGFLDEALLLDETTEILLVQPHARQRLNRAPQLQQRKRRWHQFEGDCGSSRLSRRRRCRVGALISGVHAREIKKNTRLQLLRVEAMLHQIADTDDALQLVILDNRQVTDPR